MLKIYLLLIGVFSIISVEAQQISYPCYFQTNSSKFESDSIVKLETWLQNHTKKQTRNIELIAYTDTIGSIAYNDVLAAKRLETISEILKGLDYSIVSTKTVGKRYNIENYTNDNEFRKVEILFQEIIQVKKEESFKAAPKVVKKEVPVKKVPKTKKVEPKNIVALFESMGNNTIINLDIEFKSSSDVYKDKKSEDQIVYLAEYLKQHPEKNLMILGHVCCTDDKAISVKRAKRVYDDLKKQKISKTRLSYKGLSNTVPLVEEVNEKTRQQNRRVEVYFYE